MKRRCLAILATSFAAILAGPLAAPPSATAWSAVAADDGGLLGLLPESTVVAVEVRDLSTRWDEIRRFPAIVRFLDALLDGTGLEPDDLPAIAGRRAMIALVPSEDGRTVVPIAVVRPASAAHVEAVFDLAARCERDGARRAPTVTRGRDALWIAPEGAADRLSEAARGNGRSLAGRIRARALARRLPSGGLVRGWIHPEALADLLRARARAERSGALRFVENALAAELDAIRFAGFRRDVTPTGIVTEAVIAYDLAVLPAEVGRLLSSPADPALAYPPMPPGTVAAAAFTPNGELWLPWMRYLAAKIPNGPFRNLEFWLDEIRARTGRDVDRDLVRLLGERGRFHVLDGPRDSRARAFAILETADAPRLEASLLDLRAWLSEHVTGRSLGGIVPIPRDEETPRGIVRGLRWRTPLGRLEGPAFAVRDRHLIVGSDPRAVRVALRLLDETRVGRGGEPARQLGSTADAESPLDRPHGSLRIEGTAVRRLARQIAESGLLAGPEDAAGLRAIRDLAEGIEGIEGQVRYERDAVRIRATVRLTTER
jgi:hypothetical protein